MGQNSVKTTQGTAKRDEERTLNWTWVFIHFWLPNGERGGEEMEVRYPSLLNGGGKGGGGERWRFVIQVFLMVGERVEGSWLSD